MEAENKRESLLEVQPAFSSFSTFVQHHYLHKHTHQKVCNELLGKLKCWLAATVSPPRYENVCVRLCGREGTLRFSPIKLGEIYHTAKTRGLDSHRQQEMRSPRLPDMSPW